MNIKYWASRAKKKGVLAPRHGTYIDWLKEKETEIAIKLGAALADFHYSQGMEKRASDKRRVDTLGMMKDIISDAIDREKI
jgi:hypothetical protein